MYDLVIAPIGLGSAPGNVSSGSQSTLAAGTGPSFGNMLKNALTEANGLSAKADSMAASYAAGGPVSVDQLMIAEQQASLAVSLVVQVRDRVVSAYQSIMNMQI